jgi:hypothetical protein
MNVVLSPTDDYSLLNYWATRSCWLPEPLVSDIRGPIVPMTSSSGSVLTRTLLGWCSNGWMQSRYLLGSASANFLDQDRDLVSVGSCGAVGGMAVPR